MIKKIVDIFSIYKIINTNKIKRIFKFNNHIIDLLWYLKLIINELLSKTTIALLFIICIFIFNKFIAFNTFIFGSIVLTIIDSHLFSSSEFKKIMFHNFRCDAKMIVSYYYIKLYIIILFYLPGIIVFSYLIEYSEWYFLLLYIGNCKIVFDMLMLILYRRKIYYFNGDDFDKEINIILIILIILYIFTIILRINLNMLIKIINTLGILANFYIIFYKDYEEIVCKRNFFIRDYDIKENISIENNYVKEIDDETKYLNKLFNKRFIKYILFYLVRSILVSIIFLYYLNYKNYDELVNEIFTIMFISTPSFKLIDLYYYKCDFFLRPYICIKKLRYERLKKLLIYNFCISLILIIFLIIIKELWLITLVIMTMFIMSIFPLNLLYIFKIYIGKGEMKSMKFYYFYIIVLIMLIIIDFINVKWYILYLGIIIFLLINVFIYKKYIGKDLLGSTKNEKYVVK